MPENKTIMELFAEDYRTNPFFRDLAIAEIKVAYRVMSYLSPDDMEKYDTKPETMKVILEGAHNPERLQKAAVRIMDECEYYCGSGHWQESLEKQCAGLIKLLIPGYIAVKASEKEWKRLDLLKQLEELDKGG